MHHSCVARIRACNTLLLSLEDVYHNIIVYQSWIFELLAVVSSMELESSLWSERSYAQAFAVQPVQA